MTTKNGLISLFLRNFSSFFKNAINDPVSTKILTIIYSIFLIIITAKIARNGFQVITLLVIYGSSLIYSILALLVVIFKKQEEIGESKFMKKIFGGRKVFWHEIHTTATFVLFNAQLSAVTLVFSRGMDRPEIDMIFSVLSCCFLFFEFYRTSKAGKEFVLEENLNKHLNCFAVLLGPFHCCPMFFNIFRNLCFIVSAVLIAKSQLLFKMNGYYFQSITSAILASFVLFLSQIYQACKTRNSSTLSTCGRKWQTLLLLIITTHAFLAVLSLSVTTISRTDTTMPIREYQTDYGALDYGNEAPDTVYDHIGEKDAYDTTETSSNGPKNTQRSPPNPRPTISFITYPYQITYYGPRENPIPFALTCLAFVLSFLELYSRAIRFQSIPNFSGYNKNITIPEKIDISATANNHDKISKINDLSIVIAAPHHFTHLQIDKA